MIRIHSANAVARWRFRCPDCDSVDWRVWNGVVKCRNCNSVHRQLFDAKEGRIVNRDELEIVGPGSEKVDFASGD